jgi:hypothetical protein
MSRLCRACCIQSVERLQASSFSGSGAVDGERTAFLSAARALRCDVNQNALRGRVSGEARGVCSLCQLRKIVDKTVFQYLGWHQCWRWSWRCN